MAEKPLKQQRKYVSYLLRLWRETGAEEAQWRASLQNPHTGERTGLASIGDLLAFLEEETEPTLSSSQHQADEGGEEDSGPEVMG